MQYTFEGLGIFRKGLPSLPWEREVRDFLKLLDGFRAGYNLRRPSGERVSVFPRSRAQHCDCACP